MSFIPGGGIVYNECQLVSKRSKQPWWSEVAQCTAWANNWRFWLKKPSVMLISIIVKRAQTSKTEGWTKLFFLWLFDPRQAPYLQVEVSYLLGVQVEDPIQDLLEELSGLLLAQRLLLCQEVKELPAGHAAQEERKKERERKGGKEIIKTEGSVRLTPATNPCWLDEPSCCNLIIWRGVAVWPVHNPGGEKILQLRKYRRLVEEQKTFVTELH